MLYAAIDYLKYRHRKGRYSKQAMENEGFALAIERNFPGYKSIPLGHIAFVSTSGSLASWLIMYACNGAVSHVTMFYGEGVLHDTITSGVQRRPFSEYFDGISYIRLTAPPPSTDLAYAKAFMDSSLGASYNWLGIARLGLAKLIGNHHGAPWYLCADILLTLGVAIGVNWVISGDINTTASAILAAYPNVFAFNKYRNRNWLKEVSMQIQSRAK
jgi:hypothetical protein